MLNSLKKEAESEFIVTVKEIQGTKDPGSVWE